MMIRRTLIRLSYNISGNFILICRDRRRLGCVIFIHNALLNQFKIFSIQGHMISYKVQELPV